ncbi:MAG TPA: hypothetical protein PKX38_03325 [Alphaproteobacteria bacterium]|nr:hypothetical protein [Micavibrio sp.]MBK9562382.1 hypothetical protein [Micavibrio sp.]HQX26950.1 hypothetical protein [Alphaproteobacteria bacterium]
MISESTAENWANALADMREAVSHDTRPIVLDLGFRVDSMRPRLLEKNPDRYHLVTLNSTQHYLEARGLMNEFNASEFGLAERLEVSYDQKRIPHSEFAMDDEKSVTRLAAIYNELARHRIIASTIAEDRFPHYFPFTCTIATREKFSHMPLRHPVYGNAGEIEVKGQKKIILLEGAEIADTAPKADELKEALLSPRGVNVIARLRVNLKNARENKKYYRAPDTTNVYPKLMFTIYGECQLAQNLSASLGF